MSNRFWRVSGENTEILSSNMTGYSTLDSAVKAHEESGNPHALIAFCEESPRAYMEWGKDIKIVASCNQYGWLFFGVHPDSWENVWRKAPEQK